VVRVTVGVGGAAVVRAVVRGTVVVTVGRGTLGAAVGRVVGAGTVIVGVGGAGAAVGAPGGGDLSGTTSPISSSVPRIVAVA